MMIEIPVTQDDIDKGVPDYAEPDRCVIALALKRHFGESVYVAAGARDAIIGEDLRVYKFDDALIKFDDATREAFHESYPPSEAESERPRIRPGVIRLDKQAKMLSYEEMPG